MELLHQFEVYLKSTDSISAQFYCSDLKKFTIWFEIRYGSFDTAITPLDLVKYRSYLQFNGGRHPCSPKSQTSCTGNCKSGTN